MIIVGARLGHHDHLRSASADGRAGVGGVDGDLGDLIDGGAHRRIIEGVGADVIILDVDAVDRDGGERTAESVDGGDVISGVHAGLCRIEVGDLAVEDGQILNLLVGDGRGDLGVSELDGLRLDGDFDDLRGRLQFHFDGPETGFLHGIDFDVADLALGEAGGFDGNFIAVGLDGDKAEDSGAVGFAGKEGLSCRQACRCRRWLPAQLRRKGR